MTFTRSFLPILAALLLVGCSEDEVESPTDTGVEDTLGDAGDATVDSTPDTSIDVADGAPDTTILPDAEGDAAEAGGADAADAVGDAADASLDSADVATDAAETSPDAAETSVDAAEVSVDAGPAAPSELWIVRVGDGSAALDTSATPVFIDRRALPGGALLGSIAMPTASADAGTNQPLTVRGDAPYNGRLMRSLDGRYVTLGGVAAPVGTASVEGTSTATFPRVIGRVDALRNVDTSTTTTSYSAGFIATVLSTDGTKFWLGGRLGGVMYVDGLGASGAATKISSDSTLTPNVAIVRTLSFFDGGLLGTSSQSWRVFQYGTLPTTLTAATVVSEFGSSTPNGLVAFKRSGANDLMYFCDESAGVQRWELVSGTWTMKLALGTPGCGALTGYAQGSSYVLIAMTMGPGTNSVVMVTDDGTSTTAPTPVTIATEATNTAFRGVSLPPTP